MAAQEFLASFAVDIDEGGVSRLQSVLEENRKLADELASAFGTASSALREFAGELGALSGAGGIGGVTEGFSGGLTLGLDLTQAQSTLKTFIEQAKKPIPLKANASAVVSAARSAYNSVKSMFSQPITITAKVKKEKAGDGDSGTPQQMSAGGRFTRPTEVEVAEDGDAEYIIPVKKENRAVPLLRQLLSELSPAARESLTGSTLPLSGGLSAGTAAAAQITQNNSMVSAPVNIQVHAAGASPEQVGERLYDVTERYLLRTLQSAFPG